jgi:hypothetical protein
MSDLSVELSRTLCFGIGVAVGMVAGSALLALMVIVGLKSPADAPLPEED